MVLFEGLSVGVSSEEVSGLMFLAFSSSDSTSGFGVGPGCSSWMSAFTPVALSWSACRFHTVFDATLT